MLIHRQNFNIVILKNFIIDFENSGTSLRIEVWLTIKKN